MIVGIVLAVLLLILVCLVVIFLKATERACFADDTQPREKGYRAGGGYNYQDPKRAQPHHAQVPRLQLDSL